jgi:hypothetical protein
MNRQLKLTAININKLLFDKKFQKGHQIYFEQLRREKHAISEQ